MKTIASFIEGKIRRSEVEASMRFEGGGDPHPELGACEGRLFGPAGTMLFHERGMVLSDGSSVSYVSLSRVSMIDRATIELALEGGAAPKRIAGSEVGAELVYATLRWIGNAILHKRIAD